MKKKTYREIIAELDAIANDESKSKKERDAAWKKRNDIVAELTLKAYG
tara:strand:- start:2364 stop:2507 length:144 start_codon:yes stop_codon:yes gene_type:complete